MEHALFQPFLRHFWPIFELSRSLICGLPKNRQKKTGSSPVLENSVKNCDENEEKDTYPSLQIDPALPHTPRFDVRKSDTDALIDDSEAYIEVPDPVQLTVSSIGSIGGVLEDVPEHCELGIRRDSAGVPASSVVSEATETFPLLLQEGGSSRPTPKIRHHSFGSQTARTVLTANPAEGNFTLNIFRTR